MGPFGNRSLSSTDLLLFIRQAFHPSLRIQKDSREQVMAVSLDKMTSKLLP